MQRLMCVAVGWLLLGASSVQASILFVTTLHQGAQVQLDVNHTQYWEYTPTANVFDIAGGLFEMKKGPHTTEAITLDIIQGTYADFGSVVPLLSVTLGSDAPFTQSFSSIYFKTPTGSEIDLYKGTTYTAVLHSNAADRQAKAYFIKGGSETPLSIVDPQGIVVPSGPLPEPASLCVWFVLAASAAALAWRRRKPA